MINNPILYIEKLLIKTKKNKKKIKTKRKKFMNRNFRVLLECLTNF
jgi:uncharacterized membrane protein